MKRTDTRKVALLTAITAFISTQAPAQFTAGKLAVLRAGDNGTSPASSIVNAHQTPTFIDEYDPATPIVIANTNMGTNGPTFSVAIPTNDPPSGSPYQAMWVNGHVDSEGYLALSEDASTLSFTGFGGDILAQTGSPENLPIPRGICVIDASGNSYIPYEGSDWYGLGAGIRTDPRGVVSDNGTNNFFGSGSEDGNEWYQLGNGSTPEIIQNYSSTRAVKIINGYFYTSLQADDGGTLYPPGIYDFSAPNGYGGLGSPVLLPEGNAYFLNLVVPASPYYPNVESFDISPQGNVAYMADNVYGIQKYIEVAGNWTLACAFGITNNTSTGPLSFPASYTGCFGLVVDWSGTYPVVFATTTEGNGGYANENRLIRLDDNYNFTDGQLHTNVNVATLATAWSANVAFLGLSWVPDRRPVITSEPASQSGVTGTPVTFTVAATTNFANSYFWYVNGTLDGSQTAATYSLPSATVNSAYQVVVSNQFGAVTSTVASLTVTAGPAAPHLTSPVPSLNLTNAVDDIISLPVAASGTTPLNYQWWFSASAGSTIQLSDGGDYTGSSTSTLSINISSSSDSGSYYVVINNSTETPASNLVATLDVVMPLPVIFVEPINTIAASNGLASFTVQAYPLSANYQWYQGTTPLSDGGRWSGSQSTTLLNSDVQGSDAGDYYAVVTDAGGSVTSAVVSLTVETPAPFSAMPYTVPGLVYQQNFDSLPDPGTTSVNTSSGQPTTIDGITYNIANPFDFAGPIGEAGVGSGLGGLGLSNTMAGWFSSDTGAEQIQATTGDNTTGLIISFGCTNAVNTVNPLYSTNNRALGMISSSKTASGGVGNIADAVFALRLVNLTGQNLTNMNLSYVSELWRETLNPNIMTNYYYVDPFGTNTTPTNNWTGGLTNLAFSTNLGGISKSQTIIYGTNAPVATTNMAFVNVPLTTNWPPGGVLWIVWEETTAISGGQGIGIDNLVFSTGTQPTLAIQPADSSVNLTWPQMFTAYTLQYNTNLANTNGWQTVTEPVTAVEGINTVVWPIGGTQVFFRLELDL
jgi:hypothetical protein